MLPFDVKQVQENARKATTEDLLDRVTAYREGMEPEALDIIEAELRERGVGPEEIEAHTLRGQDILRLPDGVAVKCSFCHRPAVVSRWGVHKLFGLLPVLPRRFYYCAEHRS
ncbi:MAG: hypothetical protein L0Z62_26670 [Gemmataceae bacterium]|nr:hypothetical protein [Gemmataceae bacterium]